MSTSKGQRDRDARAKPQAAEGRDARGRFTAGNKGGPGNPFARKVAQLRKALVNFVTEDDMKHVAFILKEKAMGGDLAAIKLLFQFVLGKPTEAVDPDRLDVDEWEKMKERARPPEEAAEVVDGMPAEMACRYTKMAWPAEVERNLSAAFGEEAAEMVQREEERAADQEQQAATDRKRRKRTRGARGQAEVGGPMGNGANGSDMARLARLVCQALAGRYGNGADEAPSGNGGNGGGG